MKIITTNKILSGVLLGLLPGAAWSQFFLSDSPLELNLAPVWIDNFNPTLTEEVDAWGVRFRPNAQFATLNEGYALQVKFNGGLEHYQVSGDNPLTEDSYNFASYRVKALSKFFVADAWEWDLFYVREEEEQRMGSGVSGLKDNVLIADDMTSDEFATEVIYGNENTRRFMSLRANYTENRYENNSYSSLFDIDQTAVRFEVGFRNSDKSNLSILLEYNDDDLLSPLRRDSQLYAALVGGEWDFSGKSTLKAYVGGYRRTFTGDATTGAAWRIQYRYQPVDYFSVEIGSSRASEVGDLEDASSSERDTHTFSLNYDLNGRWEVGGSYGFTSTDYDTAFGNINIEQVRSSAWLTLNIQDFHELRLSLSDRQLEEDTGALDYQQTEVELNWRYAF